MNSLFVFKTPGGKKVQSCYSAETMNAVQDEIWVRSKGAYIIKGIILKNLGSPRLVFIYSKMEWWVVQIALDLFFCSDLYSWVTLIKDLYNKSYDTLALWTTLTVTNYF